MNIGQSWAFIKYIREKNKWRALVKVKDETDNNGRRLEGTTLYCSENYRTKFQALRDVRANYKS